MAGGGGTERGGPDRLASAGASTFLICYDIADPKRLVKVHKHLKARALAVQYSVFAGNFTPVALARLIRCLRALINEREDDVRVYPVPRRARVCLAGGRTLGDILVVASQALASFLRTELRTPIEKNSQERTKT